MRLCERNLTSIHYALYNGMQPIKDADENDTGRYEIGYENPVEIRASVSAARGYSDVEQFGVNLDYEKTVITTDMTCPITETSVLWVDTKPEIGDDGSTDTPFDYRVVKVARSLNYIAYAIKKAEVS